MNFFGKLIIWGLIISIVLFVMGLVFNHVFLDSLILSLVFSGFAYEFLKDDSIKIPKWVQFLLIVLIPVVILIFILFLVAFS